MAPSSLKKMSWVQERKEGNYASLERTLWSRSEHYDLGLTLLPGSQIQRKDEMRSRTAAESSSRKLDGSYVETSEPWKSFETEIQPKHPTHPNKAKNPSNSPDPGPDSAKLAHVTARINRERPYSQNSPAKDSSGVVQHNVLSIAVAPIDELDTTEIQNTSSCQNDNRSPGAAKRRKLGTSASNEIRDSKVSKGKAAAFETYYDRFHMHHNQHLSDISAVGSGKMIPLAASIRGPSSEAGRGLWSSKRESRRQIAHSPHTSPARSRQNTGLGSEDTALHSSPSALAALASRSPTKHRYLEPQKLTVRDQSPKSVSTQHGKYSRLFLGTPAETRTQVLKPTREVTRSWTCHFPAKAKISRHANLPAPSFPFTPSEAHEHPHPINAQPTSTNLQAHTHSSSTHPLPSLPKYLSLSEDLDYPSDVCALEEIFDTAHTGNQGQLRRRRSASMPNLSSTSASKNMDSGNSLGPASMPTPPQEQPSPPTGLPWSSPQYDTASYRQNLVGSRQNYIAASTDAGNSAAQNLQFDSHLQPRISLSDKQNIGFTSSLHPCQVFIQPSDHQDVTGPSVSKDGEIPVDERQYSRRRLEVKPNYSYEEVKLIVLNVSRQAQILKAENASLQSSNTAMKKGYEGFQHQKVDLLKRIQHYERVVSQKDQQMEAMRRAGSSLQHQYKRIWDEHHRLLAIIRKENGTGNPSAIAERIRWNHLPNAVDVASRGRKPSANTSPVYRANGAQPPVSKHGFEQTFTGFQGPVQPVSFSGSLGANVGNASSQVSVQPGFAAANHNSTNSPQDGSTGCEHPNRPLGATASTVTTNLHDNKHPTEQEPTERVTIDLTDGSQPPAYSASHNISVQQKENFARMAGKSLSWLQGENPYRRGANTEQRVEMSNIRHPPLRNREDSSAMSPEAGRVAPLPETATGRRTKNNAPKKTRAVLDPEAKKERAKIYRKTAAEKKKREKKNAKQLLQDEDLAKRAQKQDRRVAKEARRQKQTQKPSEQVGPLEPQKTLDGQLYQEDTSVQHAILAGSMEQAASDDQESLFGDSEVELGISPDADTVMQDDDAAAAEAAIAEAAMVAEMEAEMEADADSGGMADFEQDDTLGGQTFFTTDVPNGDHGYHDFSSESEESEEE